MITNLSHIFQSSFFFLSVQSSYFDLHFPDFLVYLSVFLNIGQESIIYGATVHLECGDNYSFYNKSLDTLARYQIRCCGLTFTCPLAPMQREAFY